jgi:phosphatidylglycerol lysyltransferase
MIVTRRASPLQAAAEREDMDRPEMGTTPGWRLEALRRFAVDAVAFQGLESAMRWWRDASPPDGTGAALAYIAIGRSWIAAGGPLIEARRRAAAVRRFVRAARRGGYRPVFFGVEALDAFDGLRRLRLGQQSELRPSAWAGTLRARPRLREQLRRARAHGVLVRRVEPAELGPGAPLRAAVERLRDEWLGSRPMEPMEFLVSVEPFHEPAEHLYFVAERGGVAVQFLSVVPIHGRHGWLMEDMLRSARAPNGTTELLIDRLMRELGGDPHWVTPGLTPLVGDGPRWLRAIRDVMSPLYDFTGLLRFRSRLAPSRWAPVWMVWDRGPAWLVLVDVLRAFAGGRLLRFAVRTLVRHPNGPPWAVALPLAPWTLLVAALAATGRAHWLGFSTTALWGWAAFDLILAWLLFGAARRPRWRRLAMMATAAAFDALVSWRHLRDVGLGPGWTTATLRLLATAGPTLGAVSLAWAAWRASLLRRSHR